MTTPRVIELPRRLEATSQDTFLGLLRPDSAPLAPVVALRPRERRLRVVAPLSSDATSPYDDAA